MIGLILLLLVVALVAACAGLHRYWQGVEQDRAALARTALDDVERQARRLMRRLDARIRRHPAGRRLELRVAAAGLPVTTAQFAVGLLAAAVTVLVLVGTLSQVLGVLAAAGTVAAAFAHLHRRQSRRSELFVAQLPELARVLSNATSAGRPLRAAISTAAEELGDPAGAELERTAELLRLGHTVEEALNELGERLPSRELAVLVTTLVISTRAGGTLVSALRNIADTLEDRKELRREIRTQMSGSVYTGRLVAALGVFTLVILEVIRPGVLDRMTTHPAGQVTLVVSGLLYLAAFTIIRRTTRVEP